MANNRTKTDAIHDLLPRFLNTKTNTNWAAIIGAIGEQDQNTADLITEVRKQFFIKTASRPYLDRLAANSKIARPRLVGMDDTSFRQYVPILAYRPKQVKLIIDQLLDIFFFKESTTAYITSQNIAPFILEDGWDLSLLIDELNSERIAFTSSEFTSISAATADEIVACINRQVKYCYATAEYDSISKNTYIRIFTRTIGSKGSLRIVGGRANIAFQFNGFISTAGNGFNTEWTISKVGEDILFQHTGGLTPGLNQLQVGDIVLVDIPGNTGSFPITSIDLANQSITFKNLFATTGTFIQSSANDVKFIESNKYVAYFNNRRAMTWETSPGEITIEMPTSPPVVKRTLKGSAHMSGNFSTMMSRDSGTSMTLQDAMLFSNSGTFFIEEKKEIKSRYSTPLDTYSYTYNSRMIWGRQKYTYTSRTALSTIGDIAQGSLLLINLASIVGLSIGQQITMTGVPPYAEVVNIFGNTVTMSYAATSTSVGATVSFMGNQLTGISPTLPEVASVNEFTNTSMSRLSNIVTVTTSVPHNFQTGSVIIVSNSSGILSLITTGNTTINSNYVTNLASVASLAVGMLITGTNIPSGSKVISISGTTVTIDQSATATGVGVPINMWENLNGGFIVATASTNTITYKLIGLDGTATSAGTTRSEKIAMAPNGSRVFANNSQLNTVTRINGPYMWDLSVPFTLSSLQGVTAQTIQAGKIVRLLTLGTNTIPSEGGYLIFDYGLKTQEGPVRYLYKPTDITITIDPSYTFKQSHSNGSAITLVRSKGPHVMSGRGIEYPLYITDPSEARKILQELIISVKSAGIFVNFLIRFPENIYGTLDVYQSGVVPTV